MFLGITLKPQDRAKGSWIVVSSVALSYQALWVEQAATLPIPESVLICPAGCSR
jgi:hypothetical protein